MEKFISYLKKFGFTNQNSLSEIRDVVTVESIQKDDFFLEAGIRSNRIAFVAKGVFRIYFYDREGNEITRYFVAENQFLVNLQSFQNRTLSSEYIQSLTDGELVIIGRKAYDHMINEVAGFKQLAQELTENALLEKMYDRSELLHQDATTRYLTFLEKHPHIVNRIPLGHLSSYLGIAQQSLSRIRKEMVSG